MSQAEQDEEPRIEEADAAGEHVKHEVDRARRLIQDAGPRERWPLYIGPEGGAITERVLAAIFAEFGLTDLRTLQPIQDAPADLQADEVFEAVSPEGLKLILMRVRIDDGDPLVELEFVKPAS